MNTLNEISIQPWWTALFDRFGAAASSLCAIHCLCLPWAFVAFPFVADSILANQTAERAFIGVSVLLAACCGVLTCRKHGFGGRCSIQLSYPRARKSLKLGQIAGVRNEISEALVCRKIEAERSALDLSSQPGEGARIIT